MAHKYQKLYFLTIFTAIFYLLLHKVRSFSCENELTHVTNCWDLYINVQFSPCTLGNFTKVGSCTTIGMAGVKGCDSDVEKRGRHRSRLYTVPMDIICKNKTIYDEFDKNKNCWKVAHTCASAVTKLPMKTSELICRNVTAILDDCKSPYYEPRRSQRCLSVTSTFLDEVLKESGMCGASSIFCHFILLLVSFCFLTLM